MPPRPPASSDADLHATLDLLSQVVANISDRLDRQSATLDRLAKAQGQVQPPISPDRVAAATAQVVRDDLGPRLTEILDAMEVLNGGKALLNERWRAFDREEARHGRWKVQPWAVVAGIPLALVLLLALAVPRAAAHASFTCRATGGTWSPATEHFLSGCTYSADKRAAASRS